MRTDRLSLPLPKTDRPDRSVEPERPRCGVEARLAGIWAEVLGVDDVAVDKSFLELGGDSLQAARIAVRVLAEFKLAVTARELLKGATVAQRQAVLAARRRGNAAAVPADAGRLASPSAP